MPIISPSPKRRWTEQGGQRFEIHKRRSQRLGQPSRNWRIWEIKQGGKLIGSVYQKVSEAKAVILAHVADLQGNTAHVTPDGLRLALDELTAKWRKQGANFHDEALDGQDQISKPFEFDGQAYEVTIFADKTIRVYELLGDERRLVLVSKGLSFPKGFTRTEGYDR